ncbi:unnamed protein product [Calicophoron daubneyi]|uniref:Phosducin domain-containing protein n=1 Tax=Calicophoron daubneyi TaxID=300641 RepID=A0AAV2THR7_CALDB
MSLSLDDKLLGEKVDNYCSESEDEGESDGSDLSVDSKKEDAPSAPLPDTPAVMPDGQPQTGPKGVLSDYKKFQKLKAEKVLEEQRALMDYSKKHSMSCRSYNEDVAEEMRDKALAEALEKLDEDDEFMVIYRQKRMHELKSVLDHLPVYEEVFELTAENFVSEIDQAPGGVTVVVHIHEQENRACTKVNECFKELCKEYPHVKFCRIRASNAHLSYEFSRSGVPAILVYKKGELIGNLLKITQELGEEIYTNDLENYLIERGFLPDRTLGILVNARLHPEKAPNVG